MSNRLDPDQARHLVGPDLGQNCLQRLSADNTSRRRVNRCIETLTKSIVLALAFDSSLHHVSHQSHSCGNDFIATWWIILLGRSWSKLERLLGSWLRPWYWPLSRSPAAIRRNLFKSITYNALKYRKRNIIKKIKVHYYFLPC